MHKYDQFYASRNFWQNTLFPHRRGEMATVSRFMICHSEKPIAGNTSYAFIVRHVYGFHGRGFMASVHSSSGWRAKGELFYGDSEQEFNKAKENGLEICLRLQREYDEYRERADKLIKKKKRREKRACKQRVKC